MNWKRFNTRYLEVSLSGYMSFLLSRLDRPIIVSLFNAFMFFSSICASQLVWHEDSNANDSWHLIFPEAQWDKVVWQSLVWEKTTTTRRVKTFLTKIEVTQKAETSRRGWQKELIIFCVMMTTTKEMNDAWNQETKKHMTRNEKQKGNKEQSNRKTQAISSQPFLCSYHNNQWWTGMMPSSCDAGDVVVVLLESCLGFLLYFVSLVVLFMVCSLSPEEPCPKKQKRLLESLHLQRDITSKRNVRAQEEQLKAKTAQMSSPFLCKFDSGCYCFSFCVDRIRQRIYQRHNKEGRRSLWRITLRNQETEGQRNDTQRPEKEHLLVLPLSWE